MRYRVIQENKKPNPKSQNLVDEVAESFQHYKSEIPEWFEIYDRHHRRRIAHDIDYIKKYVRKEERILDIGAAPFLLTGSLKKLGYNVCGVDIRPERFSEIIDDLNLRVSKCNVELEQLPFGDSEFNIVIFNEIFEHLRINPIFTMKEILRVVKVGGILLLSTPNLRSLKGIVNFLFRYRSYSCCDDVYDEYKKIETLGSMGHVREYTYLEVANFLEKAGFIIKEIVFRGTYSKWYWTLVTVNLLPRLRPFMTIVATRD